MQIRHDPFLFIELISDLFMIQFQVFAVDISHPLFSAEWDFV